MVVGRDWWSLLLYSIGITLLSNVVAAYEVPISDADYDRQICSGMWGGKDTFINVTFDSSSPGQVAMVVYEWRDVKYLGKVTSKVNDLLPKTYVCTSDAVRGGFCDNSQLGRFILDLPKGKSINETTFWSARVGFFSQNQTIPTTGEIGTSGFWDNPEGNPDPPDAYGPYTSPWKRSSVSRLTTAGYWIRQDDTNTSPQNIMWYREPIQYLVRKTGYYCVAIVPITVIPNKKIPAASNSTQMARQTSTDVPYHATYKGTVLFRNTFKGKLPAADYPKVNFYFAMFIIYTLLGAVWGWQCFQNKEDLLPLQYYISSLLGFLIIEMIANWAYYRYLNAHGKGTTSTVFLIVVAILDAGRNSLSFFLLLVVSLGLSVVRESLGRTMIKCQALAAAHFIFGVLYAVGIVELELESTSAFVLLIFVIPLAFTLSGFLLWILYSLNATIQQLEARKQRYKLRMFKFLYRILLASVVVIAIFFVVSSMTFSGRLAEDYGAKSWRLQWWLLDGWLALLYLVDFSFVAFLWRPSPNNRRLAMFDEIAQNEEDAEDYDMEALEHRTDALHATHDDDDTATLVGGRRPGSMAEDDVVFEIGDEDAEELGDEEDAAAKKRRSQGTRYDHGEEHEREGLMRNP